MRKTPPGRTPREADALSDSPNEALRALMIKHDFTVREIAEFSGFAKSTVESWLKDPQAKSFRPLHDRNLSIIRIYMQTQVKLSAREARRAQTRR